MNSNYLLVHISKDLIPKIEEIREKRGDKTHGQTVRWILRRVLESEVIE